MQAGRGLMGLTAWTLLSLAALACSSHQANLDPLKGDFRIQIVTRDNGMASRVINAGEPWHYQIFWMGELPKDEVAVVELIDHDANRGSIYEPSDKVRFSFFEGGLIVSKEEYYRRTGSGRYKTIQPGESIEPPDPFRIPPIEGDDYAADNPTITLKIEIWEVSRTGRYNSFGAPEYEYGKLLAKDERQLRLVCNSCQV